MNYSGVLDVVKNKVSQSKGKIYYGVGTIKELNSEEKKNYPLTWVLAPVTFQNQVQNEILVLKTYSLNVRFLQSVDTTTTREDSDKIFDDLNVIVDAFIMSVLKDISNNPDLMPITFGTVTQIYKQQGDIHIGWNLPVFVQGYSDEDMCCSIFDD